MDKNIDLFFVAFFGVLYVILSYFAYLCNRNRKGFSNTASDCSFEGKGLRSLFFSFSFRNNVNYLL